MVQWRALSSSLPMAQAHCKIRMLAYCAYGYRALEKGVFIGFNGERWAPVSHGYLLGNGYRLYRPILRRFLSADSSSPFGTGGLNTYAYCAGDPVNRIDPSGHKFSLTGGLKAVGLMKRTGRTLHSEFSVLSYDRGKSQPKATHYRALDMDFADAKNHSADLENALRSEQIRSVFYEYLAAQAIGALGDMMSRQPDAEARFTEAKQQIFDQSLSRIRKGLPPHESNFLSEQRTTAS